MNSIYYIVVGVLIIIFPVLLPIKWLFDEIVQANPDMEGWRFTTAVRFITSKMRFAIGVSLATDLVVVLLGGKYITQLPILVDRPSCIKDDSGQYISPAEEILLLSSFHPNGLGNGMSGSPPHLICSNLSSNARIAIINPNDVVPSDVVVAEVTHNCRGLNGNLYSYRLSKCDNTGDPDHIRRETGVLGTPNKPFNQMERDDDKRTDMVH